MVFANISAKSARELIGNVVVIDLRTIEEFKKGHLKNAVQIDFYSKDFKDRLNDLDKRKKYLIYCHSGNRSLNAMKIMFELGFENVFNLSEGILEWNENGFEIVR